MNNMNELQDYKRRRIIDDVYNFVLEDYEFLRAGQLLRDNDWDLNKVKKILNKRKKKKGE